MITRRNLRASIGTPYRPGNGYEWLLLDAEDPRHVVARGDLLGLPRVAQAHWHRAAARYETDRPGTVLVTSIKPGLIYAPKDWRGRRIGAPLPPIDHAAKAARSEAAKARARRQARV